jgi:hypothetical protein
MSIRVIDRHGKVLGVLELVRTVLLADLEPLRRLGVYRIEVVLRH